MVPGGVWGPQLVVLICGENLVNVSWRHTAAETKYKLGPSRTSSLRQKETPAIVHGESLGLPLLHRLG